MSNPSLLLDAAQEHLTQAGIDILAAQAALPLQGQSNPLQISTYVLPVTPPANNWYIAQKHWYPSTNPANGVRHTGLDINLTTGGDTDLGEPVRSTCAGVVVYAKKAPGAYWGNLIITMSINAAGRLLYWRYAHLDEIRTFTGAIVRAGDEIGTIGKGGYDRYWAHLHWDGWLDEMITPGAYASGNVNWIDPLAIWTAAGYSFDWGVRK